jgi:hypothetical protein
VSTAGATGPSAQPYNPSPNPTPNPDPDPDPDPNPRSSSGGGSKSKMPKVKEEKGAYNAFNTEKGEGYKKDWR